jgi:hypothetical protein
LAVPGVTAHLNLIIHRLYVLVTHAQSVPVKKGKERLTPMIERPFFSFLRRSESITYLPFRYKAPEPIFRDPYPENWFRTRLSAPLQICSLLLVLSKRKKMRGATQAATTVAPQHYKKVEEAIFIGQECTRKYPDKIRIHALNKRES